MAAPRQEEKSTDTRQEKASFQSAQQTASSGMGRASDAAADVSGRAARIGIELVRKNSETAQQAWDASARIAMQVAKQATDQFGRAVGLSGEDARDVLQDSSNDLDALLDSTNVLASASQEFSNQWLETIGRLMEGAIGRSASLAGCRTAQEFFAKQVEFNRECLNTVLHGTRRLSEISGRAAQEATAKMSDRLRHVA